MMFDHNSKLACHVHDPNAENDHMVKVPSTDSNSIKSRVYSRRNIFIKKVFKLRVTSSGFSTDEGLRVSRNLATINKSVTEKNYRLCHLLDYNCSIF